MRTLIVIALAGASLAACAANGRQTSSFGNYAQELAELAEIHPICHAREAPITMQMVVDRLQVEYEVDRDRRLLTVTALSERVAGRDENGSSGAL